MQVGLCYINTSKNYHSYNFIYFLVQINNHQGKPLFMSQKDKYFYGFIFWRSVKLLFTVIIFKTDSKKELSKNIIERQFVLTTKIRNS